MESAFLKAYMAWHLKMIILKYKWHRFSYHLLQISETIRSKLELSEAMDRSLTKDFKRGLDRGLDRGFDRETQAVS